MSWANPFALLALGALAVPVLVHLVRRELRSGQPFASLMFVERVTFDSQRRRRLRNLLLLALRLLAMTALVLAFAGPRPWPLADPAGQAARAVDTVVLLDTSFSMSGAARWSEALGLARQAIRDAAQRGRVSLLTFDEQVQEKVRRSDDVRAVLTLLDSVQPAPAATRIGPALQRAADLLATGGSERRELVLVSDLQRSALRDVLRLPAAINLSVRPVVAPVGANLSLIHAAVVSRESGAGVQERVVVTVRNTGHRRVDGQRLSLSANDLEVGDPLRVSLEPGAEQLVELPLVLAADGPTRIAMRLSDDAVSADNGYFLVVAPRRPIRVAQVLGAPTPPHNGAYLRQALAINNVAAKASVEGSTMVSASVPVMQVSPLDLAVAATQGALAEALARYDVLLLEDAVVADGSVKQALTTYIEGGGGVLVSAGPNVARTWQPAADGLLPASPRGLRSDRPKGIQAAVRSGAPAHPLWRAVGAGPAAMLGHALINTHMDLAATDDDVVLARLDDGSPLLLERRRGAGRILVLATSADPRWSTLVLEPGFAALVQSMVIRLAGRQPAADSIVAYRRVDLKDQLSHLDDAAGWHSYLDNGDAQIVVEGPDRVAAALVSGSRTFVPTVPGLHVAHARSVDVEPLPIAVNPDPREARFEASGVEEFMTRIERSVVPTAESRAVHNGDSAQGDRLAGLLLAVAALLLAMESILSTYLTRSPSSTAVRA